MNDTRSVGRQCVKPRIWTFCLTYAWFFFILWNLDFFFFFFIYAVPSLSLSFLSSSHSSTFCKSARIDFPPSVLHWPPLRLKQRLNYWISVASLLFSCARICFLSFSLVIPLSSILPLEYNLFQRNCLITFRPNPKPLDITCVFVCVFIFTSKPCVLFSAVFGYVNVMSALLSPSCLLASVL